MNGKTMSCGISMEILVLATALLLGWPVQALAYKVVSGVTAQWCFAHNGDVWIGDDENSHGDCIMERVKPGSTLADVLAATEATSRQAAPGVDCKISGYCTVRMSNGKVQTIKLDELSTVKLDSGPSEGRPRRRQPPSQ